MRATTSTARYRKRNQEIRRMRKVPGKSAGCHQATDHPEGQGEEGEHQADHETRVDDEAPEPSWRKGHLEFPLSCRTQLAQVLD